MEFIKKLVPLPSYLCVNMIDTCGLINKNVVYSTLGCKLNFAETSTIVNELATLGIHKVHQGEQAGIGIVNTCSVTDSAEKKSRQLIRRIHKSHPDAYIIVTGCYAQLKPEDVALIEGVDLVLGTEQKKDISTHILAMIERHHKPASMMITSPVKDMKAFVSACSADDRTRHFLKVQDGCDYYCSYCTVPFARGQSRNGSIAHIIKQAEQVAANGGKEIVLTGVNTGDFGKSTQETFIDLLKALDKVNGIARFRISSIEPNLITDEIISFVADSQHFMPHFHIPLQSGSDAVLKLMHRRYNTTLFRQKTELIRKKMPDAFIGIDIIIGTRGETDDLFNESKSFLESTPFSQLHVFSYSERPGTQALKITPVVPPEVKRERSKQLLSLSDNRWREFYSNHQGKIARVLFEQARKSKNMAGFTENYIKTEVAYQKTLCNSIHTVQLAGWNEDKTALTAIIMD